MNLTRYFESKPAESRLSGPSWIRKLLREDDDSGQALIEVAVSALVLIIILGGAAEFGFLAYEAIEVSSAARAGVQYGAQTSTTSVDLIGMQDAARADAPNVSGLTATASHFCSCANGSASTCLGTDCAGSRIVEYIQVNTSATVTPPFSVPTLPLSYNLTGLAVMRVGQ